MRAHCGLCGAGGVKSSKCVSVSTGSHTPPTSHDHVFATLCVRHVAAQRPRPGPRPTRDHGTGHRTLDSVHKTIVTELFIVICEKIYATTKRLERRARARAKRTSAGAIMQAIRFRSDIASRTSHIPIQIRSRALLNDTRDSGMRCVFASARPDHMHALLRTRLTTWGGASVHYLLIASPVAPLANLIHIGAEDALGALG